MWCRIAGVAGVSALCVAGILAATPSAVYAGASQDLPVNYDGAWGYLHASATSSPPGANNWSCRPNAEHPRPVVLVHGTFGDMSDSWQALSPLLVDNGYCVFALNYGDSGYGNWGVYGTADISQSAQQLSVFVEKVLSNTGASQVDVVGHSQGGMMPRYYIKFLGGASKVHTLVGLAPSNHGTTFHGIVTLASLLFGQHVYSSSTTPGCPACAEQEAGSPFMEELNSGGDTVGNVDYTVVETTYDEVVTPYTSAFLSGPNVTDITLQDQCPLDLGDHLSMPYDHIADTDVLNSLDPTHPRPIACSPVLPVNGG